MSDPPPDLDALRQRQQERKAWSNGSFWAKSALEDIDTLLACLDAQQPELYLPRMSFFEITEAMITKGGGFVQQLGRLLRQADETNKRRLVLAFQDYWKQYDELAALLGTARKG